MKFRDSGVNKKAIGKREMTNKTKKNAKLTQKKQNPPCRWCNGTGKVEYRRSTGHYLPCPDCEGRGTTKQYKE
ncbi:MAG: hypothetical protein Kow0037_00820 [Calditrichia bacterium]